MTFSKKIGYGTGTMPTLCQYILVQIRPKSTSLGQKPTKTAWQRQLANIAQPGRCRHALGSLLHLHGWSVTFGTARRRLGGATARPGPSSLYQM